MRPRLLLSGIRAAGISTEPYLLFALNIPAMQCNAMPAHCSLGKSQQDKLPNSLIP